MTGSVLRLIARLEGQGGGSEVVQTVQLRAATKSFADKETPSSPSSAE